LPEFRADAMNSRNWLFAFNKEEKKKNKKIDKCNYFKIKSSSKTAIEI
jgi:hypothetical protein